jgi:hypothetical protein
MRVETPIKQTLDSGGKSKKIETRSYHCEVCNSFVRSEEREVIGE